MKVLIRELGEKRGVFVNIDGAVIPQMGETVLRKDAYFPKNETMRLYQATVMNRSLIIDKDDRGMTEAYVVLDLHSDSVKPGE